MLLLCKERKTNRKKPFFLFPQTILCSVFYFSLLSRKKLFWNVYTHALNYCEHSQKLVLLQDEVKGDASHVGVEKYLAEIFESWAIFRAQYMIGSGNNKDCEEWFFDRKWLIPFHIIILRVSFRKIIWPAMLWGSECCPVKKQYIQKWA